MNFKNAKKQRREEERAMHNERAEQKGMLHKKNLLIDHPSEFSKGYNLIRFPKGKK